MVSKTSDKFLHLKCGIKGQRNFGSVGPIRIGQNTCASFLLCPAGAWWSGWRLRAQDFDI